MGGKGWNKGGCRAHTLTPWPPPDGRLRPQPRLAGRRAVSVHEDQLQAPAGEGGRLPVGWSTKGDGEEWAPFVALVLKGPPVS